MKRLTIPRLTLQVQIIAVVLAGLFLFDTLEPALDRWVGQSAVRPDLKQAVERVRTLADLVGHAPPEGRAAVLEMAGRAGWRLDLAARARAADLAAGAPDDGMLDRLGARLLVPDDVLAPVGGWRTFLDGRRVMAVEVDDRTLLIADFASPQMQLREVTGPLPNYLLALVILCLLFAVFSGRVITRPLRRIAAAAAEADLSGEAEIFEERGSTEIVTLARALNRMRRRIVTMVESRTRMLRGISHDLRTPLTRIRLRADRVADPDLRAACSAMSGGWRRCWMKAWPICATTMPARRWSAPMSPARSRPSAAISPISATTSASTAPTAWSPAAGRWRWAGRWPISAKTPPVSPPGPMSP